MANDKALSEPVCLADRCGKSASRSVKVQYLDLFWPRPCRIAIVLLCFCKPVIGQWPLQSARYIGCKNKSCNRTDYRR